MSGVASQHTTHLRLEASGQKPHVWERLRRRAAFFWVGQVMLSLLERWPWIVRCVKPAVLPATWLCARVLRRDLLFNASRILGPESTLKQRRALGMKVLRNFYDFMYELGCGAHMTDDQLRSRIAGVEGRARYDEARARCRGAILVTAHLGSFEVGMISLRQIEPRVHVVFRRDPMSRFERMRQDQHERLGVQEAIVSDGLHVWMSLRDALENDEVVLMQGDRVMPDQRGERIAFCHGHMMFPPGPVKLSLATGAPIVPIFNVREPDGRVRIFLEEPIYPQPQQLQKHEVHPALLQIASVIERYVTRYPDQWLRVQRAFCEDIEGEGGSQDER